MVNQGVLDFCCNSCKRVQLSQVLIVDLSKVAKCTARTRTYAVSHGSGSHCEAHSDVSSQGCRLAVRVKEPCMHNRGVALLAEMA